MVIVIIVLIIATATAFLIKRCCKRRSQSKVDNRDDVGTVDDEDERKGSGRGFMSDFDSKTNVKKAEGLFKSSNRFKSTD